MNLQIRDIAPTQCHMCNDKAVAQVSFDGDSQWHLRCEAHLSLLIRCLDLHDTMVDARLVKK